MPSYKPNDYRRGDALDHNKFNDTENAVSKNQLVSSPNRYVSKSLHGTSISEDYDASVSVGQCLVITETCGPCTGFYPNFQFGRGRGEILDVSATGMTSPTGRIVDIWNTLPESIPARSWPVQAKTMNALILVDVAPCAEG
jgi:hypothetical protein